MKNIFKKLSSLIERKSFSTSGDYWNKRYQAGGNSGKGSYDKFAEFKAEIINPFLKKHKVGTVIELGCGDGNQLRYFEIKEYIGVDISETIIQQNQEAFSDDHNKNFVHLHHFKTHPTIADVTMSLDVIYHLVEDEVFSEHMRLLFEQSSKYVIIYSSNKNMPQTEPHVRHRQFDQWIEANTKGYQLMEHIANPYTYEVDPTSFSHADFYIYKRDTEG